MTKRGGSVVEINHLLPQVREFMELYGVGTLKQAVDMLVLEGLKSYDINKGRLMGIRAGRESISSSSPNPPPPQTPTQEAEPPMETDSSEREELQEEPQERSQENGLQSLLNAIDD